MKCCAICETSGRKCNNDGFKAFGGMCVLHYNAMLKKKKKK